MGVGGSSPLASTKAHASVLFLLQFLFYNTDSLFLKLWGFGEDAIACCNTLGVAGVALLARVCLLLPKHTHVCFFCCRFVFYTTAPLFLKVLVEDKILYGVNAMKFNVDMPFCLFTKTVQ